MHDPHESWPLFRTAMERLCDKHIPKKTISNEFQAPWFDTDCEKFFVKKKNGGLKLIRKEEQKKIIRNFVN